MGFVSVMPSTNNGGRRGPSGPDGDVLFRLHGRWKSDPSAVNVSVCLSLRVMKEMRWVIGDVIDIQVDVEAGLGLIRRLSKGAPGGRTLQPSSSISKDKHGRGPRRGEAGRTRCYFRVVDIPATLFAPEHGFHIPESIELKEEGILFALRKPGKSPDFTFASLGQARGE